MRRFYTYSFNAPNRFHGELLVERVESGGAGVPEFCFATSGIVDALVGNFILAFNGFFDSGSPFSYCFLKQLNETGVAADHFVRHVWGDFGHVNCNVSVSLLKRS